MALFTVCTRRLLIKRLGTRLDTVPERAAVDAAKELGYDSLKDLQLAVIRGIVSWQECTHFPLFQKCE